MTPGLWWDALGTTRCAASLCICASHFSGAHQLPRMFLGLHSTGPYCMRTLRCGSSTGFIHFQIATGFWRRAESTKLGGISDSVLKVHHQSRIFHRKLCSRASSIGHASQSPKGPHHHWLRPRALLQAPRLLALCLVVALEFLEICCSLADTLLP